MIPLVSIVTFLPGVAGLVLLLLPRRAAGALRPAGLAVAVATFLLSLPLYFGFDAELIGYQFEESARWMPTLGVSYHVGIDGISLLLVLLTTFLMPLALASAWGSIEDRIKEFVATMLILETGMLGVFVSLDLFLFYMFWEAMLIPMYFVIGVWGGPNRIYAAVKFVLYTMVGSLLMLVAILALYYQYGAATGRYTFDLPVLAQYVMAPGRPQDLMFLAFALAFAIKVPLFPFHTWLPDAHVEAPTAGSVILAGVLLKMGTYGFLRFALPLFPLAALEAAPWLVALSVIGIVYGALVATVQPDLKKLVAYSSVSHLGFVMLGLFALHPTAVAGSVYQMLNHGLSTGGLFLLVGMIYERRHTRLIADFGGLWTAVPVYAAFFLVVMLASVGLPGLNGFVGEFLILLGSFGRWPWATAVATSGVILGALYLLWMYERVIFGPLAHEENAKLEDLSAREVTVLLPVVALCLVMGLFPAPFLRRMQPSIDLILQRLAPPPVVATR